VSLLPSTSRSQLKWQRFTQQEDGSWCLVLPPFYARLFELHLPALVQWPYKGFRDSQSAQTRIARFQKLLGKDVARIRAFLDYYARVVILNVNEHIKADFKDELDHCLALDFNKPTPGPERTEIGELEYRAKYQRDKDAMAALVSHLVLAIRRLPRELIPKPRLLTYVPSDPVADFCLPALLAKSIIAHMDESFWGATNPLVTPALKEAKKSAKNITVKDKLALWRSIIEGRGIKLSLAVKGHSVCVIDDLYQSGASLWSFAKYLKRLGAARVVGVVCVKSLRDKDNQ